MQRLMQLNVAPTWQELLNDRPHALPARLVIHLCVALADARNGDTHGKLIAEPNQTASTVYAEFLERAERTLVAIPRSADPPLDISPNRIIHVPDPPQFHGIKEGKLEFKTDEALDDFLNRFPNRECTDTPGVFALGNNEYIAVRGDLKLLLLYTLAEELTVRQAVEQAATYLGEALIDDAFVQPTVHVHRIHDNLMAAAKALTVQKANDPSDEDALLMALEVLRAFSKYFEGDKEESCPALPYELRETISTLEYVIGGRSIR